MDFTSTGIDKSASAAEGVVAAGLVPEGEALAAAMVYEGTMPETLERESPESESPVPKVSVIIPLYYAEEYIGALLEQLCEQPLEDIEIICVVDGSPDGTLDIVKEHAAADARIQWLYQENAGAGAARNAGLELAKGEYLAFLDADDLYDPLFLTKMYEAATSHDADLVVCQFNLIDFQTGIEEDKQGFIVGCVPEERVFNPEELQNPFPAISTRVTNMLFRKNIVESEQLRFSETHVANDLFFFFASVVSSKRIVAIPDNLITVRRYVNPESISSNRALHSEDVFGSMHEIYIWLKEHGLEERYATPYTTFWASAVYNDAMYEYNERFIRRAVEALTNEEPWSGMSDKELRQTARLDTGVLTAKRLIATRKPPTEARAIELERIDNAEAAIGEIVHLLNTKYGKHLPEEQSMLRGIIPYVKDKGLRYSAATLIRRLRKQQ